MDKLKQLKEILHAFPGVVVAYSGGVDSAFLAYVAHEALGEQSLMITAVSPTYPEHQLKEAQELAARFGWAHQVIYTNEFEEPNFLNNPPDRCYYCKKALMIDLVEVAEKKGWVVLDGANYDDLSDHRPGHKAAEELGVRSPLQEVGMTKQEIREISKALSLPTWDKPAYACLASRVPYGNQITPEVLQRIDAAENYLASLGLIQFRVRDHHPIARIEVSKSELEKAWQSRESIATKLHELGYPYVTIDMDGFRSGSMNEIIRKKV